MLIELEHARARLAHHGNLAAAVRRRFGLEWTRNGYRALIKRTVRMQELVKVPRGVDVHVLRLDPKRATAVVEWSDTQGRIHQAEVPQIALVRYARKRAARFGQ